MRTEVIEFQSPIIRAVLWLENKRQVVAVRGWPDGYCAHEISYDFRQRQWVLKRDGELFAERGA